MKSIKESVKLANQNPRFLLRHKYKQIYRWFSSRLQYLQCVSSHAINHEYDISASVELSVRFYSYDNEFIGCQTDHPW